MPIFIFNLAFIPLLLEIVDQRYFLINLPGIPLSFARVLFIIIGLFYLKWISFNSMCGVAFLIFIAGVFIASFLSPDMAENISRSLGMGMMTVGALGFGHHYTQKQEFLSLDLMFFSYWGYWICFVLELYLSGSINTSYGFDSPNQTYETVNHHILGMGISVSAMYLLIRCDKSDRLQLLIIPLLGLSIACILISQSRSNFMFLALTVLVYYLTRRRVSTMYILKLIVLFLVSVTAILLILGNIGKDYDRVVQRFNMLDTEYQQQSNQTRTKLLSSVPTTIANHFWGTGPLKPYIAGFGKLAHNQYLTFMIMGGLVSMLGVLFFLFALFRHMAVFRKFVLNNEFPSPIVAIHYSMLTFFITLFTVEYTSLFFFLMLSLLFTMNRALFYRVD